MAEAKVSHLQETQKSDQQAVTSDDPDKTLTLTMDQYRQLKQVYYGVGELSEMIDPPAGTGGGLQCPGIVNSSLGEVLRELEGQLKE